MKKMAPLVCVVLIVALIAGLWAVFGKNILSWYYVGQAQRAMESGRGDRAVQMLEKQLALDPGNDAMRMRLVDLLVEVGIPSRAEYHLTKGLETTSQPAELYKKLCAVYVSQDKLYDAVELLSGIKNPKTKAEIEAVRPAAPALSHPGGEYKESVELSLSVSEGCAIYISWEGEIPSMSRDKYVGPVRLSPGSTYLKAVAVGADGLVSGWVDAQYKLTDIIYPVVFMDSALEAAVRDHLQKYDGELMSNEVYGITELDYAVPGFYTTLSDLEPFSKLTKLRLVGMDMMVDVSALGYLSSLETLSLENFRLDSVDLETVAQLTGLKELSLPNNNISSIAPLEAMTALEALKLDSNSILEIGALSAVTGLRSLSLSQNAIEDISPLGKLEKLREIDLSENRILKLNGLEGSTGLERLNVGYNYIDDIQGIRKCTALKVFLAGNNKINSLSALSGLTFLEELTLNNNQLESVEGLSGLTALKLLDISSNAITGLGDLSGCAALTTLEAGKNQITSVSPLSELGALETLNVEGNKITTLAPLKSCAKLKTVNAFGNPLTDTADSFAGTGISVMRD